MADMSRDRYFENIFNAMRFWTKKAFADLEKRPEVYMNVQSKGYDTTEVSNTCSAHQAFLPAEKQSRSI